MAPGLTFSETTYLDQSVKQKTSSQPTFNLVQPVSNIDRLFKPSTFRKYREVPSDELVVYSERTMLSQLQKTAPRQPKPHVDPATAVVYISGACRSASAVSAKASYGVYFGPGSPYNTALSLAENVSQSHSRAEVEALAQAIEMVDFITIRYENFKEVKIVTNSQYLVDGMSMGILNGLKSLPSTKGKAQVFSVEHFDCLMELHQKMEALKRNRGVNCQLWYLAADDISEAHSLAEKVLYD